LRTRERTTTRMDIVAQARAMRSILVQTKKSKMNKKWKRNRRRSLSLAQLTHLGSAAAHIHLHLREGQDHHRLMGVADLWINRRTTRCLCVSIAKKTRSRTTSRNCGAFALGQQCFAIPKARHLHWTTGRTSSVSLWITVRRLTRFAPCEFSRYCSKAMHRRMNVVLTCFYFVISFMHSERRQRTTYHISRVDNTMYLVLLAEGAKKANEKVAQVSRTGITCRSCVCSSND